MRRVAGLAAVVVAAGGGAYALAQDPTDNGVIGPASKIQPSGRQLTPAGKLTRVGNHPGGGALTPDGRFYWTLSAGRGRNDVRIVRVAPRRKCRKPARGASARRKRGYKRCLKRARRPVGRVVQTLPMPGLSGGIAIGTRRPHRIRVRHRRNRRTQTSRRPAGTPGKEGDVIHVLRYNRDRPADARGHDPRPAAHRRADPAELPADRHGPEVAGQRDLAVSRDGKTLLAALNLADRGGDRRPPSQRGAFVAGRQLPVRRRDHPRRQVRPGLQRVRRTPCRHRPGAGKKMKDIQVGPHLSHPEAIAIDPKRDRAYVASRNQDLVAVIDTTKLAVERTLSVERPQGNRDLAGRADRDPRRLPAARAPDSGEDAVAVFALPTRAAHVHEAATQEAGRPGGRSDLGAARTRRAPAVARVAARAAACRWARTRSTRRRPRATMHARVGRGEGPRRRPEPERPEPAVAERLGQRHQQLPVPAVDRRRAVAGIARLPDRQPHPRR